MFPSGDKKLIMADGGYVSLDKLEKQYHNCSLVKGDPVEMAR